MWELKLRCCYRSQGKVMFSEACVIHSVHRGVRAEPPGGSPLVLTSSGGHCSSWYASYWNVFLFYVCIQYISNISSGKDHPLRIKYFHFLILLGKIALFDVTCEHSIPVRKILDPALLQSIFFCFYSQEMQVL